MQHPFQILESEYLRLIANMRNTRLREAEVTARNYLRWMDRYRAVSESTGVPAAVIAAIHYREASGDFKTNLANGDPLTGPTTHVPAGRPPLQEGMSFPVGWNYAAIDALIFDGMLRKSGEPPWTWAYVCWKIEGFNGFGPRARGIHSGYLWAGTNHYLAGKYVRDGAWKADVSDRQLGVVPLMAAMVRHDRSLALAGDPPGEADPPARPAPPAPVPEGLGRMPMRLGDTADIQSRLNELGVEGTPLVVDGSYGRRTRAAVRAFQVSRGLEPDGLAGPLTRAALAETPAVTD